MKQILNTRTCGNLERLLDASNLRDLAVYPRIPTKTLDLLFNGTFFRGDFAVKEDILSL